MKLGQGGFGLVQIMIAVAGVAGISYTIMNQGEVDRKIKVKANFDQHFESQSQSIRSELSDILSCSASFAGKTVGTETAPTNLAPTEGIFKGTLNINNQIIRGSKLFGVKTPGSSGVYVDKMQLLNRPHVYLDHTTGTYVTGAAQDVLRIFLVSGTVGDDGVAKPNQAVGMGASERSLDIPMITKLNAGAIQTCYFDANNSVKESCTKINGAVWNDTTKECELPNAIQTSELVPLWTNVAGVLVAVKPPDVANGEVTCQKNGKRCSRTSMDCNLPACPANHYRGGDWEWDRCQQRVFGACVDHACMKSAKCMYVAQPAGQIVKP